MNLIKDKNRRPYKLSGNGQMAELDILQLKYHCLLEFINITDQNFLTFKVNQVVFPEFI